MTMTTTDALRTLSELLEKGWKFKINGGGVLIWEVELVGRGLAYWRACDSSFGGAAAAAIKGATEMEDDPFVVIGRNARALFDLIRDSFGTAVNFEICPAPSDDEFGPTTIEVAVHPWPGQTPAGQAELEAAFLSRALKLLPLEIARPLRIRTRWPEEEAPRGAASFSAGEVRVFQTPMEPARSAEPDPYEAHPSVAGILWKGISLLTGGWTSREVHVGDAVATVEKTKTGYKARIPASLIGIPFGEIMDLGNLAMVEQAENGDYLVRVSMEEPGIDEAERKVKEHLQGPARSADENFPEKFRQLLKAGPEAWTDEDIAKAFPNLKDAFTTEEIGKAMRYARDQVLAELRQKEDPARSAGAIPVMKTPNAFTAQQEHLDLLRRTATAVPAPMTEDPARSADMEAPENRSATARAIGMTRGKDNPARSAGADSREAPIYFTKGPLLDAETPPAAAPMTEDPARSAGGPMLPRLLGEAIAEIINRPGGSALTDSEVLASLDPSLFEGSSGDEIGRFIEEMRRLAWEREASARSAGRARAGEPLADCPICNTNPMPPSHEDEPARSADAVRPVPIMLRIPPPPTIEGIIGKAMDYMLELGEPAEVAFAGRSRAESGATVAWTPRGITVTLDPEHALIPIPEGFPGEVKRNSDGSITGIWLSLEDAITLSPARSAAREAEKKLLAISYLARKEAGALDAGAPPRGASDPQEPSRRLGGKNSWDRATHERLTAAVDDLVRGATRGAETDEEITGHLPTAALVAMDPQAIQDLIAWVRRARGTPSEKGDPARSAARDPGTEGGSGEDAGVPPGTMTERLDAKNPAPLRAGKVHAPIAVATILTTSPTAAADPAAAPGVPAGEENKVGYEDYVVAARALFSAVKAFLLATAGEGNVDSALGGLRDVYYANKSTLAGGGR